MSKPKATWLDLVYRFWGPCSNEDADTLLWNCTCFPFGSPLMVARQLKDIKERSGGNITNAVDIVDKEMLVALEGIKND